MCFRSSGVPGKMIQKLLYCLLQNVVFVCQCDRNRQNNSILFHYDSRWIWKMRETQLLKKITVCIFLQFLPVYQGSVQLNRPRLNTTRYYMNISGPGTDTASLLWSCVFLCVLLLSLSLMQWTKKNWCLTFQGKNLAAQSVNNSQQGHFIRHVEEVILQRWTGDRLDLLDELLHLISTFVLTVVVSQNLELQRTILTTSVVQCLRLRVGGLFVSLL